MSESRITFEATLDEKGGLLPANGMVIRARLAKWAKRRVFVIVEKDRQAKTNPQLGYYHAVVLPILAEEIGDDEAELHKDLKREYFPKRRRVSRLTGEEVNEPVESLADATKDEMSEFLTKVLEQAAKIGCYIPAPHEDSVAL